MSAKNQPQRGAAAWIPTIGLAFSTFVFNTSEFLPVGLLPDIARSLDYSDSHIGLLVTGYAWVVALMSLPLAILSARWERRKLLLWLLAIFALCHFAVFLTTSFESLMATRIGVALTHSIFWAIMTPLAARMAPEGKRAAGLAVVMGGSIVATVAGVPLGTKLGYLLGWRDAFFTIGIIAVFVFAIIYFTLPRCPSHNAGSLRSLPLLLRRPSLLKLYALTAITITGQFTAYTYISSLLQNIGGFTPDRVVSLLLIFGGAGILGSVIASKTVDRYPSASLAVPLVLIGLCLLLLIPACLAFESVALLFIVWGASMTAVGMAFQTIVLDVASDATDIAVSLYSGIFNVGIGGGAFIGSKVSEQFGLGVLAVWSR